MSKHKYIKFTDMINGGVRKVAIFNSSVPVDSVLAHISNLALHPGTTIEENIKIITEEEFIHRYMRSVPRWRI